MKQQQIHVIYIITKLELGGAQKVCLNLFNTLGKQIHTMLISGRRGQLVSEVTPSHDVFLLDDLTRDVRALNVIKELLCLYKLIKKLRQLRKTFPHLIIHTHSTKAGLLGRWAGFLAGVPYRVHTIHGYAFHNYQPRIIRDSILLLEWITSLITTHYICVSSYDAKIGNTYFPAFRSKHSIIRAAVDWKPFFLSSRSCIPFPKEIPFVFGTISCFKKQKNIFDMLKAFAWVHKTNPKTRLEIIGDGSLRTDIVSWIKEHRLDSAVTLHGWQPSVAPIMLHWHAFVLSSLWEGLPCAIIEARLLKLPIVSYTTGGIHDVIIHQKNGLLCTQLDWMELAKSMLHLTREAKMFTQLSSYKENLNDFTLTSMLDQHLKLYQSLKQMHH